MAAPGLAATRRSSRLARLLLALAAGAVSIAVAEVAVRLTRPQAVLATDRGLYQPDPPRGYRLAPRFAGRMTNRVEFDHAVFTDGRGLRVAARDRPAREHALPIVALGDSFVFGVGVEAEDSLPARLEAELEAAGRPAVVHNAGVPGFGVPDAVAWWEAHGEPLGARFALLVVFLGNDLMDAQPGPPRMRAHQGDLVLAASVGKRPFRRWLFAHSHLFVLAKSAFDRLGAPVRSALGLAPAWETTLAAEQLALFTEGAEERFRGALEATERAFHRFGARTRASATSALVVLLPAHEMVSADALLAAAREARVRVETLDPDRPARLLAAAAARARLDVLDLTPDLRGATEAGQPLYFPIDRHLTAAGHRRAAAAIARAMLEKAAP